MQLSLPGPQFSSRTRPSLPPFSRPFVSCLRSATQPLLRISTATSTWYGGTPSACGRADAGPLDDLRDAVLEAERHDVHAADPGDLSNLLDGLHAQLNALGGDFVALNAAEPSLDVVGHVDAGNTRAHELQDSQRPDRPHPG